MNLLKKKTAVGPAEAPVDIETEAVAKKEPVFWTYFKLLPAIVFIFSIVVVRLHIYYYPMNNYYWTDVLNITQRTDNYAWFKMVIVCASAVAALLFLLIDVFIFKNKPRKSISLIFMLVYVLFLVVSTITSKHQFFAIHGAMERFEGIFTLLSYLVMLVYIANIIRRPNQLRVLLVFLCILLAIMGWIGYEQAHGKDPFMTVWGQKLITPNVELIDGRTAWEAIDELAAEGKTSYVYDSGHNNVSYQTLYNPNYVPMYICAVLPLLGMLFLYFWKKTESEGTVLRLIGIFVSGGLYALELFSLYRANSANGFVGLIATFVLSVLFFNKKLFKMAEPVVALVLIFGIVTAATPQSWVPQWRQVENDLKLIWSVMHGDSSVRRDYIVAGSEEIRADGDVTFEKKPASVRPRIDYVETGIDEVTMSINGNPFIVKVFDDGNIGFYDEADEFVIPRVYDEENRLFEFVDARFHDYVSFTYFLTEDNRSIVVRLTTPGKDWDFRFDMHDRGVYFQTLSGKETPMVNVPHKGFNGLYHFGSNRGYIWATTIPMLKDYIWKGAGPDCYCMVFPQNDYATRYSHSINPFFLIVDKPHNLFLQMWINTGFFSMVAWVLMVAVYYVRVLKKGFRFDCFEGFVQAGCFLGISGFLGCALFNDGSPSTMPLFYTVLGIGFALTYFTEFTMIKEKADKPAKKAKAVTAAAAAGSAAPADASLKADAVPFISADAALKAAASETANAPQEASPSPEETVAPVSNTTETEAVNG